MTTWSQSLLSQGRREGRQEGRQEGLREGMANVLLRLLTRRFGPLGAPVIERVQAASSAELERWADNCVDGHGLNQVFGDD